MAEPQLHLPMAEPTTFDQDTGNFFKASTYNESYWDRYMASRAKYSSGFYDRIFTYHKAHNSSQTHGVAHDVGTGPGQVAAELAKHFDAVIGSDNNNTHIEIAATRLEKAGLKDKVTWIESGAEDLASKYPPGSASLLTVAECMPLLDIPRAMDTFAHLLQPDGTLSIWFYGRPAFTESEFQASCQPILNDILDLTFSKVVKGKNAMVQAAWKNGVDSLESWLDNVAFSRDIWRDVYRHKWNSHLQLPFLGPNAYDFDFEVSSKIDEETETVVKEEDPQFWAESWDVDEVRRFVESIVPSFEEIKANGEYEHIEPKYLELERAMGGKGAKRAFTWPVVLLLASRK